MLYLPCIQAFRLPFGAPVEEPPCMRQRPLGMAGDLHAFSVLVRAPQAITSVQVERMGLFRADAVEYLRANILLHPINRAEWQ